MTAVALRRGRDVGGGLGLCVFRDIHAVVTRGAEAAETGVIHGRRSEGNEAADVAGIALTIVRNVGRRTRQSIGEGEGAVVTAGAFTGKAGVVHRRRGKGIEVVVTDIASPCRGNVV